MAAVPVTFNGILYPKGKGSGSMPQAIPSVFIGMASLTGLSVGGGPIFPPDWGPPEQPPIDVPPPDLDHPPHVVKEPPPTGGWGYSPELGWAYFPGPMQPGPKGGHGHGHR
jgi:hypothetical protein